MEDYCSFEISKLLKEKGFDWVCNSYYTNLGRVFNHFCCHYFADDEHDKVDILTQTLRPTHQMAMKWLREVHNILIVISITYEKERYDWYICGIKGDPWEKKLFQEEKDVTYTTYEEAVEAALKYVLEKFEEDKDMMVQEEIPYTEEEVKAIIRQNEELRKKYNNALNKAKELMNKGYDVLMPEIFSELQEQESEDERIRYEIIAFLEQSIHRGGGTPIPQEQEDKWLAWLEKHSEEKYGEYLWKPTEAQLEALDYAYNNCPDAERGNYYESVLANLIADLHKLYEKQDEKKPIFNADDWYVSKVDGKIHNAKFIEKQDEKKPTDKIEPKFKPGDWIIFNGLILHIDEVVNGYYRTTSRGDGIHNSYDWDIDNAARLWTIQEAKDGDVLNSPSHHIIWIYKDNEHYHVCVNMNYVTKNIATDSWIKIPSDACPATKDECTILFEKMKEEGYKWDPSKKEVKTIEQKPAESTKDYNDIDPHFGIPAEDLMSTDKTESKFKVGNWFVNNISKNIFLIKSIINGYCTLEDIKGNIISACLPPCESDSHLWSIEDAKDGDVLTANVQRGELGYDEYPFRYIPITFIYRKTDKDNYYIHSHCDILCDDGVLNSSYRIFAEDFIKDIYPATKEQRDLLFQKMKEDGYEWDPTKKEVKRIEQKSIDKFEPQFKPGDWISNGRYVKKVIGINSDYPYYMFQDGSSYHIKDIDKKYYIIPNIDELEWMNVETNEDHCYSCELFDRKNNMCKCIALCKEPCNTYKGFYIR